VTDAGRRTDTLPDGYSEQVWSRGRGFAWADADEWLRGVVSAGSTPHDWASRQSGAEELVGRGTVFSVPAPARGPDERARWAVRHYRRGGALASVLGDRYLPTRPTRPRAELATSVTARARGIPTPAVVAGATYEAGLFYRADLVTELVPSSLSLADTLSRGDAAASRHDALIRAGGLVRLMADRGVLHVDVNARNILFASPPETGTFVIDLDRARILDGPTASAGQAMLDRLLRSLRKLGLIEVENGGDDLDALRAGFEAAT